MKIKFELTISDEGDAPLTIEIRQCEFPGLHDVIPADNLQQAFDRVAKHFPRSLTRSKVIPEKFAIPLENPDFQMYDNGKLSIP